MDMDKLTLLVEEVDKLKIVIDNLRQCVHQALNNYKIETSSDDKLVNDAVDRYYQSMSDFYTAKKTKMISLSELKEKHCKFAEDSKLKGEELNETLNKKIEENINSKYDEFVANVRQSNKVIANAQYEKNIQTALLFCHNSMVECLEITGHGTHLRDMLNESYDLWKSDAISILYNHIEEFDAIEYGLEDIHERFIQKLNEEIRAMVSRFWDYQNKRNECAQALRSQELRSTQSYHQPFVNAVSYFQKATKNYNKMPSNVIEFYLRTKKVETLRLFIYKNYGSAPSATATIADETKKFLEYAVRFFMKQAEQFNELFLDGNGSEFLGLMID